MLTKSSSFLKFALLGFALLAVVPAQASTVIYTSFGASFSNDASTTSYLHVNGSSFSPNSSEIAVPFTPGADFDVTSVDLLLGWASFAGANNIVDVGIYSDSSDSPGSLIGEVTPLTVTATLLGNAPQVFTADIGGVTGANGLIEGTQYWLILTPTVNNTFIGWFGDQTGGAAPYSKSLDLGTSWNSEAGGQLYFDVNGTQTGGGSLAPGGGLTLAPEPGTLVLLGLGLGAIALQRRQRSR